MPTSEPKGQDRTLAEVVAKEAIELGLETPLRDPILEAVDEAEGSRGGGKLSLLGAFGAGTALGFLAGKGVEPPTLEDLGETELPGGATDQVEELSEVMSEKTETTAPEDESPESTADESDSSSRLPKLIVLLGLVAGAFLLRRRLQGGDEEEWEPIEEFEPATDLEEEPTGTGTDVATETDVGEEPGSAPGPGEETDEE